MLFLSKTSVPYEIVDNEILRAFLLAVRHTPGYSPPCRQRVAEKIEAECAEIVKKVKIAVVDANSVAISADIATQKGMEHSYLAITAHFFNRKKEKFDSCLLDVVEISTPHTAEAIRGLAETVLLSYNIPKAKVFRYVVDNRANVVKAFKATTTEVKEDDSNGDGESGPATAVSSSLIDPNFEESFDEEETNFEDCQENAKMMFRKIVECFAHSLQLPLRSVFDRDEKMSRVHRLVMNLINKFSHSHRATKELVTAAGEFPYCSYSQISATMIC
jgi:hypothetical protein